MLVAAQKLAFLWLAVGAAVLVALLVMHRRPALAGIEEEEDGK
ncbi:hypothetical protein [Actinomadura geliboluensis]